MSNLMKLTRDFPFLGSTPSLFNDWYNWGVNFDPDNTVPLINLIEGIKHYDLEMAAPGKSKSDFKIKLDNENVMTISAEKKEDPPEKQEGQWRRKEFSYSSFSRSFPLPSNIDASKITAAYVDGVLKVHLPKVDIVKPSHSQEVKVM
ncbi:MAG: Hsp20/alpha crystallin family protein [Saprospiraceae bacterium]|nr:Hsp20/alpha crystallin family protein [Saprospiraceae bacterium]